MIKIIHFYHYSKIFTIYELKKYEIYILKHYNLKLLQIIYFN